MANKGGAETGHSIALIKPVCAVIGASGPSMLLVRLTELGDLVCGGGLLSNKISCDLTVLTLL